MFRKTLPILISVLMLVSAGVDLQARKRVLKVKTNDLDTVEMVPGSITVYSPCAACNKSYNLSQVRFSGFDKVAESLKESFFITNETDGVLKSVSLYIEYLTPEGRQLHKRYMTLRCNVPPGETRHADVDSWDRQKSFYYESGRKPMRRQASPFKVSFQIVSYDVVPPVE